MKTLQSNHVPPRTDNLVWLRGNAASSHPCKSSGSSYEEFKIPDGLVRSSRLTHMYIAQFHVAYRHGIACTETEVVESLCRRPLLQNPEVGMGDES